MPYKLAGYGGRIISIDGPDPDCHGNYWIPYNESYY